MTTKIDVKKTLFTMSGLAISVLLVLFMRSYNVNAAVKEGVKFGDWMVGCEKDGNKKLCFLSQVLTSTSEDNKKNPQHIATFRIGYFPQSKEMKMLQILPLGVNLPSGTSIILDKEKLIAPGKFTTCQSMGCIAIADLTKQNIDDLINAKEVYVGLITAEGKQFNIDLSSKGLKEGVAALK